MPKLLLAVLSWIWVSGIAVAQGDTPSVTKPASKFYLKLNPFALLELDGGIGFSGEYIPAGSKIGFQLQVQPLFFSYDKLDGANGFESPVNSTNSGMPTGIKLRPEIRYYFTAKRKGLYNNFVHLMQDVSPFRKRKSPLQTYAAIDFLYKHTQRERLGTFTVTNGSVSTGFSQRAFFTDIKKVIGFDIKAGAVSPMGKTGRWLIEAYLGIGYRQKTYSYKNLPAGSNEPERNRFLETGSANTPEENLPLNLIGISLPAGLQLVYQL